MTLRANIFRLGAHQSVAYTATAGTIATAFATGTWAVRVIVTTHAFVRIGTDPTAVTTDTYVPADVPHVFLASPGEKLSAVRVTGNGTAHVTELS